jgi:hypothetical protein
MRKPRRASSLIDRLWAQFIFCTGFTRASWRFISIRYHACRDLRTRTVTHNLSINEDVRRGFLI